MVIPLAAAGLLLGGHRARGFTFIGTQTNDSIKVTRLRGAIMAANFFGGYNAILLKPKDYHLAVYGSVEDRARTGDLDTARGHLAIPVVGKGNATIHAAGSTELDFGGGGYGHHAWFGSPASTSF